MDKFRIYYKWKWPYRSDDTTHSIPVRAKNRQAALDLFAERCNKKKMLEVVDIEYEVD